MDRAFKTAEEAEAFVREFLEEEREGRDNEGDRPTYRDEVTTNFADQCGEIYEFIKDFRDSADTITVDEVSELEHMVMWRDALWFLNFDEDRVEKLVAEYLPPSPEQDLEQLIRSVGMGYHPDTPYDGYEPPITAYTREEWDLIHNRFFNEREDGRDIYEFGLDLFREMQLERVVTYRDGSRSDQVVREEVREAVDRWSLYPVETLLETLEWSCAAQDAFSEAFKERYGNED